VKVFESCRLRDAGSMDIIIIIIIIIKYIYIAQNCVMQLMLKPSTQTR